MQGHQYYGVVLTANGALQRTMSAWYQGEACLKRRQGGWKWQAAKGNGTCEFLQNEIFVAHFAVFRAPFDLRGLESEGML